MRSSDLRRALSGAIWPEYAETYRRYLHLVREHGDQGKALEDTSLENLSLRRELNALRDERNNLLAERISHRDAVRTQIRGAADNLQRIMGIMGNANGTK